MTKASVENFYEICESIIIAFLAIIVLMIFFFRAVLVNGSSMEPTLHDGERLIITNINYTPEKGDIVVIDKNVLEGKSIIKRVIAVEGDTVKIDCSTGEVYINGEMLSEEYILEKITPDSLAENIEITVDEGFVFVLGDNRNNSRDSREIGQINEKNILGKVLLRVYPFDNIGVVE